LEKAANTIAHWWRPLYVQLRDIRDKRIKTTAIIKIQALYRGSRLRSRLRIDIRNKLGALGMILLQSKRLLLSHISAYKIQSAWKLYVKKRIRMQKVKTRHLAAAKIQAAWKGYWVRSRIIDLYSYHHSFFVWRSGISHGCSKVTPIVSFYFQNVQTLWNCLSQARQKKTVINFMGLSNVRFLVGGRMMLH
jgi:hypothetical protein